MMRVARPIGWISAARKGFGSFPQAAPSSCLAALTIAAEGIGDLVKLVKRVQKLLNLEPERKDVSDALRQVLTGLTRVVNGLAAVRSKMSDAHPANYRPSRHHAKLAVYSATMLAHFVFQTKNYQYQRGTLRAKAG